MRYQNGAANMSLCVSLRLDSRLNLNWIRIMELTYSFEIPFLHQKHIFQTLLPFTLRSTIDPMTSVKCYQTSMAVLTYIFPIDTNCRFFAIIKPLSSCSSARNSKIQLLVAWIVSIICSCPQVRHNDISLAFNLMLICWCIIYSRWYFMWPVTPTILGTLSASLSGHSPTRPRSQLISSSGWSWCISCP